MQPTQAVLEPRFKAVPKFPSSCSTSVQSSDQGGGKGVNPLEAAGTKSWGTPSQSPPGTTAAADCQAGRVPEVLLLHPPSPSEMQAKVLLKIQEKKLSCDIFSMMCSHQQ